MTEDFSKSEINDCKESENENYKDIKSDENISDQEADDYWNAFFENESDEIESEAGEDEDCEVDNVECLDDNVESQNKSNDDIDNQNGETKADSINSSIEDTENKGLTDKEKAIIKKETGWSDEIIDYIENMEQYEIYKKAGVHEAEIDGRKCLIKDIDMDYIDPKTGLSNRELMQRGRSPIDAKTGEKIELHHMGQGYDSPLVELCENSEHGDGNHSVLHTKKEESWRNNPDLKNQYNNVDKPNHWKERAKEA